MTTAVRETSRVEWLDFLRGLSAMAVVLFHARIPLWVGWRALTAPGAPYPAIDRSLAWLSLPFPFFGSAVMLFFVVSGFAIHYPHAGGRGCDLRAFAARRFFRIYPAYACAVLLSAAAEHVVATLTGVAGSDPSRVWSSLAMIQNYHPGAQMIGNPALWSLPVEAELYVAYPLLLWFWSRTGLRGAIGLAAVASSVGIGALALGHTWPMGNFLKYWIIWTAGAVFAEQCRSGTLPRWRGAYFVAMILAVVGAVVSRALDVPLGYEHLLWGGASALLVLWGLAGTAPLDRLWSPVRHAGLFLGKISYSLYLVHYPVLMAAGAVWVFVYGGKPLNFIVPVLASLFPVPIAYAMWRLVEQPTQAFGRTFMRKARPAVQSAAVVAS